MFILNIPVKERKKESRKERRRRNQVVAAVSTFRAAIKLYIYNDGNIVGRNINDKRDF